MKRLLTGLFFLLVFLASCQEERYSHPDFVYNPDMPYPILNSGDFWPDQFDQRGLQHARVYKDRLYCNTIDLGGKHNYLYCFNLNNGLVEWRAPVAAYAAQPVSFCNGSIIYCSYMGDISAFSFTGDTLWQTRFKYPYGGHWVDSAHSQLLIRTEYWKYVSVYDISTGKLLSDIESDSLQKLVTAQVDKRIWVPENMYQFERDGVRYRILCRAGELEEYKIEILKAHH